MGKLYIMRSLQISRYTVCGIPFVLIYNERALPLTLRKS